MYYQLNAFLTKIIRARILTSFCQMSAADTLYFYYMYLKI